MLSIVQEMELHTFLPRDFLSIFSVKNIFFFHIKNQLIFFGQTLEWMRIADFCL